MRLTGSGGVTICNSIALSHAGWYMPSTSTRRCSNRIALTPTGCGSQYLYSHVEFTEGAHTSIDDRANSNVNVYVGCEQVLILKACSCHGVHAAATVFIGDPYCNYLTVAWTRLLRAGQPVRLDNGRDGASSYPRRAGQI